MGRKKIEIRPLTDERNRNVTFLKRKAGLMKKAWELSVLCGAEVSILIFNNAGKPFEFSSRELDGEIDRYLEYEGLIERRRGEEFAAMAEAGEDDDDDEDEDGAPGRKNSKTLPNGQPKPVKSLKGKESFKKRMYSRKDMARSAHKRKRGDREHAGFIDGIISGSDEDGPGSTGSSKDGLAYALSMHQHPFSSSLPYPSSLPSRGNTYPGIRSEYNGSYSSSFPPSSSGMGTNIPPSLSAQFAAQSNLGSNPSYGNVIPGSGGMVWDQSMMARYAEFQLQQNHQRQQRLLLEKQRQQLAELGVPMGGEERRLLDDVFGVNRMSVSSASGGAHGNTGNNHGQQSTPAASSMSIDSNGPLPGNQASGGGGGPDAEFVWPTFSNSNNNNNNNSSSSNPNHSSSSSHTVNDHSNASHPNEGRGYYTTPESYDQWNQQHQQGGMPFSNGHHGQDEAQHGGQLGYSNSPSAAYDDDRRRREEMAMQQQQQQVLGMAHHEKRMRVQ